MLSLELPHPVAAPGITATLQSNVERQYLQRRALAELDATMQASCVEAEWSHSQLIDLYLARCRACEVEDTIECADCALRRCCAPR